MSDLKFYAVIVAGGIGKRMQTTLPKQFLVVNGRPILMHTIQKFSDSTFNPQVILVLSKDSINYWKELIQQYNFTITHQIVEGGTERFHSVKNGIKNIINHPNAIVAIHDAVRPLVTVKTIDNCYKRAIQNGNAIAAIASRDSVRIIHDDGNSAIKRDSVCMVQTPQVFNMEQLRKAYTQEYCSDFTDDASVVEKAGFPISLEEGDHFNIKITYPEDIILAESLLK